MMPGRLEKRSESLSVRVTLVVEDVTLLIITKHTCAQCWRGGERARGKGVRERGEKKRESEGQGREREGRESKRRERRDSERREGRGSERERDERQRDRETDERARERRAERNLFFWAASVNRRREIMSEEVERDRGV